jgi:hypothetical protein
MESEGTKGFTVRELRAMFAGLEDLRIEKVSTPYDRAWAGPLAALTGDRLGCVRRDARGASPSAEAQDVARQAVRAQRDPAQDVHDALRGAAVPEGRDLRRPRCARSDEIGNRLDALRIESEHDVGPELDRHRAARCCRAG